MCRIPRVCEAMKQLFEQEAPTLARQCGLRERSIPLVSLIYILVLGWWHQPKAGPSALARFATTLGIRVCKQDLDHHFTHHTATWLLALLQRAIQLLVCAHAVDLPLLRQFSAVLIEDGSSISLPSALQGVWRGCGGSKTTGGKDPKNAAGLKITVRWDLLGGRLEGPCLQEGRSAELYSVLREQVLAKGSLWLADLGYWSLTWLRSLSQRGIYFLMRLKAGITVWYQGKPVDVLDLLPEQIGGGVELAVELGARKQLQGVRLLAERVPEHVVKKRHERLREYAQDHGKLVSARALQLAQWTILVTNVPVWMLTHEQACILMRARWQIELLFKLWKQHALLDEWTGTKPWRVLCEVYAKLLAMVVQHWFVLLSCWDDPHRSLPAIAEGLRDQVPVLVHGLMKRLPLRKALRLMIASVQANCSIPKRTTRCNTSRLLQSAWVSGLT
jgi:DDE family transposase